MISHSSGQTSYLFGCVRRGIILCLLWGRGNAFQAQEAAGLTGLSSPGPRVTISLQGILGFLESYRDDDDAGAMAIRLIDRHGLDFRPTAADLLKLKEASASAELLKAIESARKPPAAIPVKREGRLEISCHPVDCTVSLDGREIGTTKGGILPPVTLSEGKISLAAARRDYESELPTRELFIRQNQTVRVEFNLKPSRSALIARGAALYRQMLDSVGDASLWSKALRVSGTISVQHGPGAAAEWSIGALLFPDNRARFEVSRGKERYQILRTGNNYVWKKRPKSQQARGIEDALRLLMNEQLSNMVRRLQVQHFTMVAQDLQNDAANTVLRAEGVNDLYAIILDPARRPAEIKVESAGLNYGMRILYSDYTDQQGGAYPKTLQVIFPGAATHVEARFNKVEVGRSEDK